MAHFAELNENNVVIRVIVVNDIELLENGIEIEQKGIDFCKMLFGSQTVWIQTSYNHNFRNVFAGPNFVYLPELDVFVLPKPFNSWVLNVSTLNWDPPVPLPDDQNNYWWNEENCQWESYT